MGGSADNNIAFAELVAFLLHNGFTMRIVGSHHVFSLDGFPGNLSLQPRGSQAKGYQVAEVRDYFNRHGL